MFTKLMLTWLLIEMHVILATEHMFNTAQVPSDGSRQRTHGSPALSYIRRLQGSTHSSAKHACFFFLFSLQRPGLEGFSPVGCVPDEPGKHTFNPRHNSYSYNNAQNGAFCISLNEFCFRKICLTFSAGCLKYYLRPKP